MIIPEELLSHAESGKILLVLGLGLNAGTSASAESLMRRLNATIGDSKPRDRSFRSLAELYSLRTKSEHDLIRLVYDAVTDARPTELHERVADLVSLAAPNGRLPFRKVLYLCYDDLLEQTLKARRSPVSPIFTNESVQYAKDDSVHIAYLWGRASSPDNLRLTKRSLNDLLSNESGEFVHWLRAAAVPSTWVCLGVDLDDEWFQSLYEKLVRKPHAAPQVLYACGRVTDESARLTWESWGARIVAEEPRPFVDQLVATLRQRWSGQIQEEKPSHSTTIPFVPIFPSAGPSTEKPSPYKGLPCYEAADESLFFGRDGDAQIIYNRVVGNRLTIITGPSGAGKSSLLRAKVVPNLQRQGFRVACGRIGELGTLALRQSIQELDQANLPPPAEESLRDYMRLARKAMNQDIVLVIDQFEELFTHSLPSPLREEVVDQIMAVVLDRFLTARVVLCLRSDFIHRLGVLEHWWPEALRYEVRIERLTEAQARQAIVGPLDALGIRYSETLIKQILEDLIRTARDNPRVRENATFGDVIDPPQLQIVCLETYRSSTTHQMEIEAYKGRDGAEGILKKYLRDKLNGYGPQQELARRVLITLVGSMGKRSRAIDQIEAEVLEDPQTIRTVLEKLENDRLVHHEQRAGQDEYELAHEYLVGELSLTPEMLARKRAEEWLRQGADEWETNRRLLSEDQFRLIDDFQHSLRPSARAWTPHELALILRCALEYNHRVEDWLGKAELSTQRDVLLITLTTSKSVLARVTAAGLIQSLLDSEIEGVLAEIALSENPPEVRRAAASGLANCSSDQRAKLRATVVNPAAPQSIRAIQALSLTAQPSDIDALLRVASERNHLRHLAAVEALKPHSDYLPSSWTWLRYRDLILTDLTLFLTAAPTLTVLMHLLVIYCLGQGTAVLTSPWRLAILRNQTILSYVLQVPVALVLVLAIGTILFSWLWVRSIGRRLASCLLPIAALTLAGNLLYRPWELRVAQAWPERFYSRAEYELTVAGDLRMARRLFTEVQPLTKEQVLVEAWLAGISYLEGDYSRAIKDACAWLEYDPSITPTYEEVASNLVTTVHWSLYQLGYDKPIVLSLMLRDRLLEEIKGSWPQSRCIIDGELSPFFFGISPKNRAFIIELGEKYAPPALYAYLGVLSGTPARYHPPEDASVTPKDALTLSALLSSQPFGVGYVDSQGRLRSSDRYATWGAFLIGDYNHPSLGTTSGTFGTFYRTNYVPLREGAALSLALQGLMTAEPEAATARLSAFLEPSNPHQKMLLSYGSPWLDDLFALLMYLWEQQGEREHALEYYARLMQYLEPEGGSVRRKLQLVCDFCNPGKVIGLDMSVDALTGLLDSGNPTLKKAACNSPYLLDLIGLRQLVGKEYSDARITFQRIATECGVAYPNLEVADYLRVVDLLEAINRAPTVEHYLRYFAVMDRSWTWDQTGSVPIPESWFLEKAVSRTAFWPPAVALEVNPWIIYARQLEDFGYRFGGRPNNDASVAVSLLRMALVYDSLSNKRMMIQDPTAEARFRRQLRDLAANALTRYLELYLDRKDIPVDFCRFGGLYAHRQGQMPGYNPTQDCVIEWLALLQLGRPDSSLSMIQRYTESEVLAMQDQAQQIVDRYPQHHLANNLLNWIAWGYCYRANLYPVNSMEYVANYQRAMQIYQVLAKQYPDGEMAKNARDNIPIIQEKLRSPEARRQVAEGRWTWDTAEKLAPRLQDLFEMLQTERQRH